MALCPRACQLHKMCPISPFLLNSSHSCPVRRDPVVSQYSTEPLQRGWMESRRNRSRIICHQDRRKRRLRGSVEMGPVPGEMVKH